MLRHLSSIACFCCLLSAIAAQSVWTQQHPSASPGARHGHAMAFDPIRNQVVLYGGYARGNYLGDTWLWDGSNWQQAAPAGATPGPRSDHAMCFDAALGMVILVGGGNGAPIMETWGWDGSTWRLLLAVGPLPQAIVALAYDPIRGVAVEFDGTRTFEWTGSGNWVQRQTAHAPMAGNNGGAMVFDPVAGGMLLFDNGETWTFDGTDWTQRQPSTGPGVRARTRMAYDVSRGEAVLFGGSGGILFDDTWAWNGTDWNQQIAAAPPPARQTHAMAYDAARQRIVMFGGYASGDLGDTWTKNPSFGTPATVTPFGAGCAGTAGTPVLAALGGTLPWINSNLVLELRSLPALIFRAPFGILGLSRTAWGAVPLPAGLAAVGMPGCTALVSVDYIAPLVNNLGSAQWTIRLPNAAALVGMDFYVQGLVVDPQANAFGAVLSNAADCVIGAR